MYDLDVLMWSLITLRMCIKEVNKIIHARRLQNIWKQNPWNGKHWDMNQRVDKLGANMDDVPLDKSM
jgi:hypothetical protein